MGMDVYGISPENKEGKYFRNNIWHWPELWTLVVNLCEDMLTGEQVTLGFTNNGIVIDADQSTEIAERLFTLLNDENRDDAMLSAVAETEGTELRNNFLGFVSTDGPHFDWKNVENFAKFCKNSGGFEIW